MQIIVKSVKVLKTGENDYGEWKLVQVTTSEDIKYTTLAKDAETISPGATINIKDMDKDGQGRESFKKYEIVAEGQVSATPPSQNEEMTPDKWDEKDRIHRESIEAQTAFKGVVELMVAKVIKPETDLLGAAALDWAMVRLAAHKPHPSPQPTESVSSTTAEKIEPSLPVTPDTLVKLEKTIVDTGYTSKEATAIISEWKWPKISAWSKLTEDQAVFLIEYLKENPKT